VITKHATNNVTENISIGNEANPCSRFDRTPARDRQIDRAIRREGKTELSMGWVDPWVGLGRDFSVFGGLGWVGSTTEKVLKIEMIMLMHLKHG